MELFKSIRKAFWLCLIGLLFTSANSKIIGGIDKGKFDLSSFASSFDNKIFIPSGNYPDKTNLPPNNIITPPNVQTVEDAVSEMNSILTEPHTPCEMFDPPSPGFRIEGRRISEAKCLEYIWEVKKKEETLNRKDECQRMYPGFSGIVGGRNANPGEFPHMGALGWKGKDGNWAFLCGSFLISDKFVLTAAHCATTDHETVAHPRPKIVRFGVENIIKDNNRNPTDVRILKFTKHKNYKPPPYKVYDIAVVELAKSVDFTEFLRPACILNQNINEAIVTGWGVVDSVLYSQSTSDHLKMAEVDIVPSRLCNRMLRGKRDMKFWKKVQSDQICATNLNGSDACGGDSGGPLQSKLHLDTKTSVYNVVGITSFGFICGRPKFPSIYTRVSSFIDWIEEKVWNVPIQSMFADDDSVKEDTVHKDSVQKDTVKRVQIFDKGTLFWMNSLGSKWFYASQNVLN